MFGEDGEVKADLHIDDIDELAKRYKVMKQRVETAAALTRNEATFTPAQYDPSTHTVTDAQYHEAMRQFKRNLKKKFTLHDNDEPDEDDGNLLPRCSKKANVDVIQELTDAALADEARNRSDEKQETDDPLQRARQAIQDRPTIASHSRLWNLNELQHEAFIIVARKVLEHIKVRCNIGQQDDDSSADIFTKAFVLALIGMGGAGKSVVIECITEFTRRWFARDLVVVTATSGNAASLINGFTWESTLSHNSKYGSKGSVRVDVINAWRSVGILIIDEISMLSRANLGIISAKLKAIKDDTRPFGGVSMVIAGDFYQLAPVQAKPMFRSTLAEEEPTEDNTSGYNLWTTAITHAVVLRENVRQQGDVRYAEALFRFRLNCPNAEDLKFINDRVVSPDLTIGENYKHVCGSNIEKDAINSFAFLNYCESNPIESGQTWADQGALRIKMDFTSDSMTYAFDTKLGKYIRSQTADFFDKKMEGNLDAIIGGPMLVKTNFDVNEGISNGTSATLVTIRLAKLAVPQLNEVIIDNKTYRFFSVKATEVECLILKHTSKTRSKQVFYKTLPPGCFPVLMGDKKHKPMRKKISIKDLEFWVQCHQFHVIPAWAITGHASQGQTIADGVALCRRSSSAGWVYVVLSRVKTSKQIALYAPLNSKLSSYKRRKDVDTAMQQIFAIELHTLTESLGEETAKSIQDGQHPKYKSYYDLMESCNAPRTQPRTRRKSRAHQPMDFILPPSDKQTQPRTEEHSGTQPRTRRKSRAKQPILMDCILPPSDKQTQPRTEKHSETQPRTRNSRAKQPILRNCSLPPSDKQIKITTRSGLQEKGNVDKAAKTTPKITRTRKRQAKRRTSPTTTSPKSKKNRKDHETDSIQQVQTIR
jgi:hypothetical protein